MIFKRKQHDGLYAVINRQGHNKIVFTRGEYETTDREECRTLIDLGYAYEGVAVADHVVIEDAFINSKDDKDKLLIKNRVRK